MRLARFGFKKIESYPLSPTDKGLFFLPAIDNSRDYAGFREFSVCDRGYLKIFVHRIRCEILSQSDAPRAVISRLPDGLRWRFAQSLP